MQVVIASIYISISSAETGEHFFRASSNIISLKMQNQLELEAWMLYKQIKEVESLNKISLLRQGHSKWDKGGLKQMLVVW